MKQVVSKVTVDDSGNLNKDMSEAMWRKLARSFSGKRAELVLRSPKRSSRANGLYWVAIAPAIAQGFIDVSGEHVTPMDAHELMKVRYGDAEMITCLATGEVIEGAKTTRFMTTDRYAKFIDDVMMFGQEILGIRWDGLNRDEVVSEHNSFV